MQVSLISVNFQKKINDFFEGLKMGVFIIERVPHTPALPSGQRMRNSISPAKKKKKINK